MGAFLATILGRYSPRLSTPLSAMKITEKGIVKTYDKCKGHWVSAGIVVGKTYVRNVNNKHYMVKHHGYGIQSDVLKGLFKSGVRKVKLNAKTVTLRSSLNTWSTRGVEADYGHGKQTFLSTDFMEKEGVKVNE